MAANIVHDRVKEAAKRRASASPSTSPDQRPTTKSRKRKPSTEDVPPADIPDLVDEYIVEATPVTTQPSTITVSMRYGVLPDWSSLEEVNEMVFKGYSFRPEHYVPVLVETEDRRAVEVARILQIRKANNGEWLLLVNWLFYRESFTFAETTKRYIPTNTVDVVSAETITDGPKQLKGDVDTIYTLETLPTGERWLKRDNVRITAFVQSASAGAVQKARSAGTGTRGATRPSKPIKKKKEGECKQAHTTAAAFIGATSASRNSSAKGGKKQGGAEVSDSADQSKIVASGKSIKATTKAPTKRDRMIAEIRSYFGLSSDVIANNLCHHVQMEMEKRISKGNHSMSAALGRQIIDRVQDNDFFRKSTSSRVDWQKWKLPRSGVMCHGLQRMLDVAKRDIGPKPQARQRRQG